MTTLSDFLNGQPIAYTSLAGRKVNATWKAEAGVRYLNICTASGSVLMAPIMTRDEAEVFFDNLRLMPEVERADA